MEEPRQPQPLSFQLKVLDLALKILAQSPKTSCYVDILQANYERWDQRQNRRITKEQLKERIDRAEERYQSKLRDAYDTLYAKWFVEFLFWHRQNFRELPPELLLVIGEQMDTTPSLASKYMVDGAIKRAEEEIKGVLEAAGDK